ncbi:putative Ig domain-containing protein [Patescibacteria group bacterium]|nr:putative Ig domain-containing protein [Patescibacteria group bacterium]MBP9710599.1 putative Ig domain-containing protein [Patescibacteria group bacterium]
MISILSRAKVWRLALIALVAVVVSPLTVQAASILPESLAAGLVGSFYEQIITAPPELPLPIQWSTPNSTLPPGLNLVPGGERVARLKGTPTTAGTYPITVRAKGSNAVIYDRAYTVVIEYPVVITSTSLPVGTVGTVYDTTVAFTGGTGPFGWTVVSGSLPAGLQLNVASGRVTGTPTTAGTYSVMIMVSDRYGSTNRRAFSLQVSAEASSLAITTTDLSAGTMNVGYVYDLSASGGAAPYEWNVVSGSLPSGLTLTSGGRLQGTPTSVGTYTFRVRAKDANARTVERTLSVTVGGAFIPTSPSADIENRLANFRRMGVNVHALVKLPNDGNAATQADSAVYYLGADGRRHAFPNSRVYFTWYSDFSGVRVLSPSDLASIPLGASVTYHPGVKMVKFTTDPRVYVVAGGRVLRWVATEAIARSLYGASWNQQIDDISDSFYADYVTSPSTAVSGLGDYNPATVRASFTYASEVMP